MLDIAAAFDQKADDRNRVGNVEEDDTGRDHAVECRIASQIQQSEDGDDDAADKVCSERDVDSRVDVAEEFGKGKPVVASEGPAEAALPCMAGDQAPYPGRYD